MASPRDDVACGTFLKNVHEGEGAVVLQVICVYHYFLCVLAQRRQGVC